MNESDEDRRMGQLVDRGGASTATIVRRQRTSGERPTIGSQSQGYESLDGTGSASPSRTLTFIPSHRLTARIRQQQLRDSD